MKHHFLTSLIFLFSINLMAAKNPNIVLIYADAKGRGAGPQCNPRSTEDLRRSGSEIEGTLWRGPMTEAGTPHNSTHDTLAALHFLVQTK